MTTDQYIASQRLERRQALRQCITQHVAGHVYLGELILHTAEPDGIPLPTFPSVASSVVQFADAIAAQLEAMAELDRLKGSRQDHV